MNERLRSAMATRGVTVDALAAHTGVDAKTAGRWLVGRTPHPRHRWKAAELLREDEGYLWPEAVDSRRAAAARASELVRVYPRRADAPPELWWRLVQDARDRIDVLVYAANFLPEQYPALAEVLREKCARGCRVRLALGDPEHPVVGMRGAEKRFGDGIASRVRNAVRYYGVLVGCPGVELRLHTTTLYTSIYRFDDTLLANTHVYGEIAAQAPLLHLRRLDGGTLFDTYLRSFEAVWEDARPYTPARPEPALQAIG